MQKQRRLLGLVGALALLLAGVSVVSANGGPTLAPRAVPVPSPSNIPTPPGIPAVKPTAAATSPSVPAFSPQDVRRYVDGNHPAHTAPGTTPSIQAVEFLTSNQVAARLNSTPLEIGRPGGSLLCLVTLRGTFIVSSPAKGGRAVTLHRGYLVFDAHSGNLLTEALSP